MLTSVSDDSIDRRLTDAGMRAILTKPAPSSLLLDTIADCLSGSQLAALGLEAETTEEDALVAAFEKEAAVPLSAPVAKAVCSSASV